MNITETEAPSEKETGRIEAFSDGVFAVAITLLVLDIQVIPPDKLGGHTLLFVLLHQWPHYLAYAISFLTILIMWANHHTLFKHIKRTDRLFLLLNGLLLMLITVVPFPTALLAEYIQQPDGHVAAAVYGGVLTILAILFNAVWRYAAHNGRLLDHRADRREVAAITRQYRFGPLYYLLTLLLALPPGWVAPSVILNAGLAIFFALPGTALQWRRREGAMQR